MDLIKVGMADLAVCKAPQKLITTGLGSCVGVCLYDPGKKLGGLAHIMLPDSTQAKNIQNLAKYADTGIAETINKLIQIGADRNRITQKLPVGLKCSICGDQQYYAYWRKKRRSSKNNLNNKKLDW